MANLKNDGVEALRADAHTQYLIEFAQARPVFELPEPPKTATAHIWRWSDYYPMLQRAAGLLDVDQTFRRSFMFSNPGLFPKPFMTPTLDGACSLYNPGETAPVHRHTPSASRFGLEGGGGFSIVEGEKCTLGRGDLVLTPNGTWHDFGNDGDREIVFIDVVNDPLSLALGATFYELGYTETDSVTKAPVKKRTQTVRMPKGNSERLFASPGVVPKFVPHERGRNADASPMFVYRYDEIRTNLEKIRDYDGSPYDGIIVEYVNPVTGAPAMPTMSFHLQLLRPRERTQVHRHTASTVYCVVEGSGTTVVGDRELAWSRNDVFVVPGWSWHAHINDGAGDAVLYSVSDEAAMRKLGFFREQARDASGDDVDLVFGG
jgi:gentisate 1,2-dioxygenase